MYVLTCLYVICLVCVFKFVRDEKARANELYAGKVNKFLATIDNFHAKPLTDLPENDIPNWEVVERLSRRYGFSLDQLTNAALHFCPVTTHITKIERFLNTVVAKIHSTSNDMDTLLPIVESLFNEHDVHMPFLADLDVISAFKSKVTKYMDAKNKKTISEDEVRDLLSDIIYPFIVNNWISARYFDNLTHREGFFGRRLASEAHAHNIGTRAALWFQNVSQPPPHVDLQIAPVTNRRTSVDKESYIQRSALQERKSLLNQEKHDRRSQYRKPLTPEATELLECPGNRTPQHPNPPVVSVDDAEKAVAALREYGVVIIRGALNEDQVLAVKRQFKCELEVGEEQMQELKNVDPNAFVSRITIGRAHAVFRGTALEPRVVALQRAWMPIVEGFMGGENFSFAADRLARIYKTRVREAIRSNDPEQVEEAEGLLRRPPQDVPVSQRTYCSLLQTVVSDPMAVDQSFHVDNAHRGLTVSVALCDINEDNGHTLVIPGSFKYLEKKDEDGYVSHFFKSMKYIWNKGVIDTLGDPSVDLKAGDVLIYDSRCFHRGRRNKSWMTRPIMLFRYDFQDTAPPGHSHLIAAGMDMIASSFSFLSNVFRQL